MGRKGAKWIGILLLALLLAGQLHVTAASADQREAAQQFPAFACARECTGWRYSYRTLAQAQPTVQSTAVRRTQTGCETVCALWQWQDGAWRVVQQTHRTTSGQENSVQ